MPPARALRSSLHPVHAVLLAGNLHLAVAALLADWAYYGTRHIQWINFSSWLAAGTAVVAGLTLAWALGALLFRAGSRDGQFLFHLLLLVASVGLAVVNSLIHARDGWAAMPDGLILSALLVLLVFAATWSGFSRLQAGNPR